MHHGGTSETTVGWKTDCKVVPHNPHLGVVHAFAPNQEDEMAR